MEIGAPTPWLESYCLLLAHWNLRRIFSSIEAHAQPDKDSPVTRFFRIPAEVVLKMKDRD